MISNKCMYVQMCKYHNKYVYYYYLIFNIWDKKAGSGLEKSFIVAVHIWTNGETTLKFCSSDYYLSSRN